ncbi:SH3 domain-containing protein [Amycolatopsis anabasis]|uniref:SH3 domain-containing protein n=1 Tax=Amycolatopsis anabasis TaxID=1840409 RepID=UPI00131D3CAD|nr:SH3 domain-containing protein [Amycolatopsis anabasis]
MSVRRILSAAGVVGATVFASAVLAVPASAAPATVATPAAAADKDCRWKAAETILIRTAPRTSATSVGQVNKGQRICVIPPAVTGGKYTACGRTDDRWLKLGTKRYVAGMCVDFTG